MSSNGKGYKSFVPTRGKRAGKDVGANKGFKRNPAFMKNETGTGDHGHHEQRAPLNINKQPRSLTQQGNGNEKRDDKELRGRGGLNVELHPLLRSMAKVPEIPKAENPLKRRSRPEFDPLSINIYVNQDDISAEDRKRAKRRQLHFNEPGKYIAKGAEMREKLAELERERLRLEAEKEKGLAADESLGEHLYKTERPPLVEWWDRGFLKDASYDYIADSSRIVYDNEDCPISHYIEHPPLTHSVDENFAPGERPMFLTKKEMKRIRRNTRQEKLREKQDRIRLGLDAPPPPKVKLSNLMNVLTNEAIKDPTAVEKQVRADMQKRYEEHMRENELRKLDPEAKREKIHQQHEKDMQKGLFTTVYRVESLENPQHLYKVDVNAKQLELVGMCLTSPKMCLIVVEGGAKSIKFYKKLLTSRIKWTENVPPKNSTVSGDGEVLDLSFNKCTVVWDGQLPSTNFKKWTVTRTELDEEAISVLARFGVESYWRSAVSLDVN